MGWFQTRTRWWETILLLVAVFILFRPDAIMDRIYEPYVARPAKQIYDIARDTPPDYPMILVIKGTNVEGDDVRKTVSVQLGKSPDGRMRLAEAGLTFTVLGDEVRIGTVKFGSRARRAGFEQGWVVDQIKVDSGAPSQYWGYIPGALLVLLVVFLQRRRMRGGAAAAA
jgi:hypothetical protein